MTKWRTITPILMTVCLGILSYIVFELRATRAYADQLMDKHCERPHVGTVMKEDLKELKNEFSVLSKEMQSLKIEVRLLRFQMKKTSEE